MRAALFQEFLKLENGVPSQDTSSRLFRLLDAAVFATCFSRFLKRTIAVPLMRSA